MKDEIKYTDEPMEIGEEVNILPSPKELAKQLATERTTMLFTKSTLDFFRDIAKKEGIPYTALIRQTLDNYANSSTQRGI
jgi:predicted DNA binding CopG/RHH family protein